MAFDRKRLWGLLEGLEAMIHFIIKEMTVTMKDPMSATEFQGPRVPGDERFDEDVPDPREELLKELERLPELDYERQLVLRLTPSLGLVLAQQVVDLMKLMFEKRSPR